MSSYFPGLFAPVAGSYQQLTLTNAVAQGLTLSTATRPKYALIQVEGPDVRWRDDGTDPTATVGMLLQGGGPPVGFNGNLATTKFIGTSGTNSTLDVSYYS